MILVFDTETTGLPDFKARSNDPKQPHLVQIALIRYADDGTEARAKTLIVKPNGWIISPEVTAIHGISHERAMDEGVPENEAVAAYIMSQAVCSLRVAHNTPFDDRIIRIAMTRCGVERDFIEAIEKRTAFDTCTAAKPIMKLPPTDRQIAAGFTGYKSPNLGECIRHFFDEDLPGAHDALVDARACARIYFKIRSA